MGSSVDRVLMSAGSFSAGLFRYPDYHTKEFANDRIKDRYERSSAGTHLHKAISRWSCRLAWYEEFKYSDTLESDTFESRYKVDLKKLNYDYNKYLPELGLNHNKSKLLQRFDFYIAAVSRSIWLHKWLRRSRWEIQLTRQRRNRGENKYV